MKIKKLLYSLIIAAVPALLAAAQRPQRMIKPDVAVPAGVSAEEAQKIARIVLVTRGWTIKEEKAGQIDASWQKGVLSAVIRVTVDGKGASVRHLRSEGLSHAQNPSGEMIHPRYNIWMRNLEKDFRAGFSSAPRK